MVGQCLCNQSSRRVAGLQQDREGVDIIRCLKIRSVVEIVMGFPETVLKARQEIRINPLEKRLRSDSGPAFPGGEVREKANYPGS